MPSVAAKNTLAVVQTNDLKQTEYWSKRLLRMIVLEQENFVFTNLGDTENIPMKQGTKTFSTRRYNHLPVGNHKLTEGVTPTALKIEGQKVSGSVDQFGAYIELTDVADDIGFDDIKNIYQPELSRHAAEVIERNVISKFTDASEYYVGVGNTAKNELATTDVATIKDFRRIALSMKLYHRKGHSKYQGKPLVVTSPNVMQDLLDDEALEKKMLLPGNTNAPIKAGTLERYDMYNISFIESLILEPESVTLGDSSKLNVYTSIVLGDGAYMVLGLGSTAPKWFSTGFTADKSDPLGQIATLGYKLWNGAKIKDPLAITKVYSASAYDVNVDFSNDDIGRAADQTDSEVSA